MRPGWKTTEFWTTLITQILTLLTILGAVSAEDAATLTEALGKMVAAVALFIANAWVVVNYIRGRVSLKQGNGHEPPNGSFPRLAALVVVGLSLMTMNRI